LPPLHIRRSTLASPEAVQLIAALNAELTAAFPEPGATHFSLSAAQVADGGGAFLIAYVHDVAIGCGAVRQLDEKTAELKRMYVDPSVRGQGIGRALLGALEDEARLLGVTRIVLETGTRLAPAINMYEAMGYVRIPLFGEYVSSPDTSLCRQVTCQAIIRAAGRHPLRRYSPAIALSLRRSILFVPVRGKALMK
jgi:putative acetyltransferase